MPKGGSAKDGFSGGGRGSSRGIGDAARGDQDAQDKLGAPAKATPTDTGQDAKAQRTRKSVAEYAAKRTAQRNANRDAVRAWGNVGPFSGFATIAEKAVKGQPLGSVDFANAMGLGIPGAVKATMDALGIKGEVTDPNDSVDKQGPDDRPNAGLAAQARAMGLERTAQAIEADGPVVQQAFPEPVPATIAPTGFQKVQSLVPGKNIFTNPEVNALSAPFRRVLV